MTEAEPPAPCRLYLVAPPGLRGDALEACAAALALALEAGDVACVLLPAGNLDEAALGAAVARLAPLAQARGAAFLLEERAALAAESGCDGVHLGEGAGYRAARARLGAPAIVGVGCAASRHAAMIAAEAGADYVGFGSPDAQATAEPELLAWWQELMTVPCVAFGARSADDCAALAEAGADFVALGGEIWDSTTDVAARVRACQAALDRARRRA